MSNPAYDADRTGLLLVDPYNDFLSDGGKLFPMLRDIAAEVRLLDNLRAAVDVARKANIQVVYVPHRRWQAGQTFTEGTWGGEWHPDFVPQEGDIISKDHWGQSGFANTDLDF